MSMCGASAKLAGLPGTIDQRDMSAETGLQESGKCQIRTMPGLTKISLTAQLIPVELVRAFHRRILNIHPALLPAFGGAGYYGARCG